MPGYWAATSCVSRHAFGPSRASGRDTYTVCSVGPLVGSSTLSSSRISVDFPVTVATEHRQISRLTTPPGQMSILQNEVVLVAGARAGIGRATARDRSMSRLSAM
ncbi:MAG: hypothetical protein JOZ11_17845 [Alphaproteobacteria bacterium]|nr:hypothetical protein [Alphaproteobacteria bacterium]